MGPICIVEGRREAFSCPPSAPSGRTHTHDVESLMFELIAHITQTEMPSFGFAFLMGFVAGGATIAGLWKLRTR